MSRGSDMFSKHYFFNFFPPQPQIGILKGICFNHPTPLPIKKIGMDNKILICDDCKQKVESVFEPIDSDADIDAS